MTLVFYSDLVVRWIIGITLLEKRFVRRTSFGGMIDPTQGEFGRAAICLLYVIDRMHDLPQNLTK